MTTAMAKKKIDWQFPNENQTVTIADFKKMVKNSEKAPHISFDEFCKVTDKWLSK
ncbi:MAG: hypothetical protein LBC48_09280 [Dysgonamonadaceae bacterium]|jgi:hypothetical protein|nr:hypothetical protein [Dysgonamonadaceae bacterium]